MTKENQIPVYHDREVYKREAEASKGKCLVKATCVYGYKYYIHPEQLKYARSNKRNFIYVFYKNGKIKQYRELNGKDWNRVILHIDNIASIES